MSKVYLTETVLRDGHQSLIATRMRLADMLPICEQLDQAGFWSLEVWGGATFDACIRYLKEDPWERLRQLRKALPNSRLQMLLRGQNLLGYRHYADDVVREFIRAAAQNGIDVFRVFDAMNDLRNLYVSIDEIKQQGKHAQGTLSYTTSPVHTIAGFVKQAQELEALGCDSIAIKDMAGLLTPQVSADLTRALVDNITIPLHLHSHATSGLSAMCQLKAIENGCRHIDTAISSFSGGTSHAPTESMVAALKDTLYDTGLDLPLLQEIGFYFYDIRKKYHQFESEFTGVDTRVQVNQVPGGMISNLSLQLKEQGALHKMQAVLDEIPRVRKDLGYPPLVTPTSQIVGTQALFNVLADKPYTNITNEVKLYLQGRYGKAPGNVNQIVRIQAIGAEEVIECRPADKLSNELDTLRHAIKDLIQMPEDVLTYAMFPELGKEFLQQRTNKTLIPEVLEPLTPSSIPQNTTSNEFTISLHGENYHIKVNGSGFSKHNKKPYYLSVDGIPEEVLLEVLNTEEGITQDISSTSSTSHRSLPAQKPGHVTTPMPAVVIDILVQTGDQVSAGKSVLITEAMKMETEIQAPIDGIVKAIYVRKGDKVNPDEALIEIE